MPSTSTGLVKPNSRMDAAIWATCAGERVLALRAYGISAATGASLSDGKSATACGIGASDRFVWLGAGEAEGVVGRDSVDASMCRWPTVSGARGREGEPVSGSFSTHTRARVWAMNAIHLPPSLPHGHSDPTG